MQDLATKEEQEIEERPFTLDCSSIQVSASLRNPVESWEITPLDDGLVGHGQSSLHVFIPLSLSNLFLKVFCSPLESFFSAIQLCSLIPRPIPSYSSCTLNFSV